MKRNILFLILCALPVAWSNQVSATNPSEQFSPVTFFESPLLAGVAAIDDNVAAMPGMLTPQISAGWLQNDSWARLAPWLDLSNAENGDALLPNNSRAIVYGSGSMAMCLILSSMIMLQYLYGRRYCAEYEALKADLTIATRQAREACVRWATEEFRREIERGGELGMLRRQIDDLEGAQLGLMAKELTVPALREHLAIAERSGYRTRESICLQNAIQATIQASHATVRERENIQEMLVLLERSFETARVEWLGQRLQTAAADPNIAKEIKVLETLQAAIDRHPELHGCAVPRQGEAVRVAAYSATA